VITSGAVTLRPVREDDLDRLYELFADLANWEDREGRPPRPMTRATFLEWYPRHVLDDTLAVEFAITVDDDRLVGRVGLFGFNALAQHAEFGISLLLSETGRGYGTDAGRAVLEFGFERHNLHRIHLQAAATNERALASYRTLGFVEEGRRREHYWIRGRFVDSVVMGVLRSEWRDRREGRTR
jgi:RimJ/RimL family protein N-acetyltransferase